MKFISRLPKAMSVLLGMLQMNDMYTNETQAYPSECTILTCIISCSLTLRSFYYFQTCCKHPMIFYLLDIYSKVIPAFHLYRNRCIKSRLFDMLCAEICWFCNKFCVTRAICQSTLWNTFDRIACPKRLSSFKHIMSWCGSVKHLKRLQRQEICKFSKEHGMNNKIQC